MPTKFQLLKDINEASEQVCSIHQDTIIAPFWTACDHVFCADCIRRLLEYDNRCPECRENLYDDDDDDHDDDQPDNGGSERENWDEEEDYSSEVEGGDSEWEEYDERIGMRRVKKRWTPIAKQLKSTDGKWRYIGQNKRNNMTTRWNGSKKSTLKRDGEGQTDQSRKMAGVTKMEKRASEMKTMIVMTWLRLHGYAPEVQVACSNSSKAGVCMP